MLSNEAILYYANHPVEFVQDILKADPDPEEDIAEPCYESNDKCSIWTWYR